MSKRKTMANYSPEVRERAVRMVLDQTGGHATQWEAVVSVAAKIGCTRETLRRWVRQAERDRGQRFGLRRAERAPMAALGRETRELRKPKEIVKKAPAYFALA